MATLHFVSGMATRTLRALVAFLLAIAICEAASVFHPISDSHRSAASELFTQGSFDSLEEAYEALRSFEVLGIDKPDIPGATGESVVEELGSSASAPKDLFYALKVNSILKGEVKKEVFEGIASRLKAVVNGASSLLDIYYSIGSLVLIKDQISEVDVLLADADGFFRSIKSLSQSNGRWSYSSDNPQSSTYAAGLAIESLAGVVSLASSEIDQSMAKVNTVLGSSASPLTVRLVRAFSSDSKDASIIASQELKLDKERGYRVLDVLPKSVNVGSCIFVFGVVLYDSEDETVYTTGGLAHVGVFVTGVIKLENAEISVLESDKSVETQKKLDLAGENAVSLSANHLQKLRLSFQLTTPLGHAFKRHQVLLKLTHDTKVEHMFVVGNSGKKFEKILDFLGLVDKVYYLLGSYDLQLTVGDAAMESSFLRAIGHVDLDLPEAPEMATLPPLSGYISVSLSQSDGRWRYSSDNPHSSTYAAGLAIEALAGVVSLASSEIDQSMIGKLNRDVSKLFDSVEKYDDVAFYFDENVGQSPLPTIASVVRGLTALPAVTSKKLKVPGEKMLGLAKFFLGIGIPGKNKDFFNQTDSLASLESNNVSVALILSLLTTVLSLTKKDQLKAKVNTVLGSSASPLTVRLVRAFSSDSKDASIIACQVLLKLTHETKVEHMFVVGNFGKKFEKILDLLGLVDKFYHLSGSYDLQLIVGDAAMENSFLRAIGHVDLDLPEATEMATRLPLSGYISVSLSQSDGRWRYSSDNPHSSTYAAGLAIDALAGVVSLASSEIDQSMIGKLKRDVSNLFDSVEKYDDGAFYFDEKVDQSPLSTTASVVRGLTASAAVESEKLKFLGEKILGLANFFLGIGIPGQNKDFFNQTDSLASLESKNVSVTPILSLLTTVLSLTKTDQLKAKVGTVLGSSASPLTVRLVRAFSSDSKDASIIACQELKLDKGSGYRVLDVLPKSVNVGSYIFVFGVVLYDSEDETVYTTGGLAQVGVFVTGVINIENAEISVLESDKSVETQKKLDLAGENAVSLSANHLQKLRLSFQLTTPLGHAFKQHQVLLKLTHETKVEHMFVVGNSGKNFEKILDFLVLVDKFFYLSGSYDLQLTVGDAAMENSFLRAIGHVDLDLPEAPEMATSLLGNISVSLSQSDGRWCYSSDNLQSRLAIEALAGVVSLASSEIDQSMICLREPCGLVCWCIVVSEERKVSYVHQQGTVVVVLKVQREQKIISYTDVQKMHSFPIMQKEIATTFKREAKPPYGGDDKDKVDMGPAVNVYRITTDAVVHEIGQIHPLSYNGDPYGLHYAVLSKVQAHISSGGLFGYATPTFQQFRIVYYYDPQREDDRMIRLNCPELEMSYYHFSRLLSGVAICDFDPDQFLVP